MKRSQLTKLCAPILREHGYHYKKGTFSKRKANMVAVVHFHKYDCADGIVINMGCGPEHLLYEDPPEAETSCPMSAPADWLPLREHKKTFFRLTTDEHPPVTDIMIAIRSLCDWIDHEVLDEQKLRSDIVSPSSWVKPGVSITVRIKEWLGIPKDYAKGPKGWGPWEPPNQ